MDPAGDPAVTVARYVRAVSFQMTGGPAGAHGYADHPVGYIAVVVAGNSVFDARGRGSLNLAGCLLGIAALRKSGGFLAYACREP